MKVLLPFALAIVLLPGCSSCNREKSSTQNTTDSLAIAAHIDSSASVPQRKERGRLIAKPLPYSGIWVNNKYLEALDNTKSMRKSQEASDMSYVIFPESSNGVAQVIWNFHEGSGYGIMSKDNQWFLTDPEDRNKIYFPVILAQDSQSLVVDKYTLTKVTSLNGRPLIAETRLFSGLWQDNDMQVRLLADGSIMGWPGYEHYEVDYDYIDAGANLDKIRLTTSEGKEVLVSYTMHGNHMEIYQLDCKIMEDDICVEYKLGARIAAFKKIQEN